MSTGRWTHSCCDLCWLKREGNREPTRLKHPVYEDCCFCGSRSRSGVYVREDPAITLCSFNTNQDDRE